MAHCYRLYSSQGGMVQFVGPIKRSTRNERWKVRRTAVHEAGHAVAAFFLHLPFKEVSIIPDPVAGDSLGHVQLLWRPRHVSFKNPRIRDRIERFVMCNLAGVITCQLMGYEYDESDLDGLLADAQNFGIINLMAEGREQTFYHEWLMERTKNLLKRRQGVIRAVADELFIRKTMSGRMVSKVIRAQLAREGHPRVRLPVPL